MTFCTVCGVIMTKNVFPDGAIQFNCDNCKADPVPGTDADTLMFSERLGEQKENIRYTAFFKNAGKDLAAHPVERECQSCGAPTMNMVFVGSGEVVSYVCECEAIEK